MWRAVAPTAVVSIHGLGLANQAATLAPTLPSQVRLRAWPDMNACTIQPDTRCAALPNACHSSRAVPCRSA